MSERASLLIVDDEVGPAESLRMIFKDDYDVRVATHAESALAILRTQPVDAITLDLQMPSMSGIDLLCAVRATDPHVGVILVTGHTASPEVIRAATANDADYVCKPFDVTHVREVVARAAARRRRDRIPPVPDWLARFAHDIRTPISAIIGYGDILTDELAGQLDEYQSSALQRIQANAATLLHMVDAACTSSRMNNGIVTSSAVGAATPNLDSQLHAEIDAPNDASDRTHHLHRLS